MTPRTINVEFHCHTLFSVDGMMPLDSLIGLVPCVGLDAVAITDHDTIEGAVELRRLVQTRQLPWQVIVGEERTLSDGSHLIGLFLEQALTAAALEEAVAEIADQGGFCLIPHPFRGKDGLLREQARRWESLRGRPAGFEIFNAKGSGADNARARELVSTGLCPCGGSDAHYESDLGQSLNVVGWAGDLKGSIGGMFEGRVPFRVMGRSQAATEGERAYALWYHRWKKFVRVPKPLLPVAKGCYRRYRNWVHGVGPKPLREVYARS